MGYVGLCLDIYGKSISHTYTHIQTNVRLLSLNLCTSEHHPRMSVFPHVSLAAVSKIPYYFRSHIF